jgi:DNA polymerase-4
VLELVELSASLGVGTNKLVAKVASDRDKPGGLTVVRPGEEAAFLAPLPVRVLWGVGPVTARRLGEMGVATVGQLAALPVESLRTLFGRHGAHMSRLARGIDSRKVGGERKRKSVSQERTFRNDLSSRREMTGRLEELSRGVAKYLRRSGVAARTIAIKLRYSDFATISRQMRLSVPTDDEQMIYQAAISLLDRAWERGRAVRLLGVAGRDLCPPPAQLPLLPG